MSIFRRRKVPLNSETLMKCQCSKCPVQAGSACSMPKIQKAMDMISGTTDSQEEMGGMGGEMALQANPPEQMSMPKEEELPGPYCSIGVAACKDLDRNKACICSTCQVYADFDLSEGKPVEHYCFTDKAR